MEKLTMSNIGKIAACIVIMIAIAPAFDILLTGAAQAETLDIRTAINPGSIVNAPDKLIAIPVSSSQINLQWEDTSDNEIRFKIERKTGKSDYFQITALGAGTTSYIDTNLNPGTTYDYRVITVGLTGDSLYSNGASATTLLPPTPVPDLVSPGNGFIVTTQTPRMQWIASQNAVTYTFQIATDAHFSNLVINETGVTTQYYEVNSVILNWKSVYYWRVAVIDTIGVTTDWSPVWFFTVYPDPVTLLPHCGCH
jgi:hypothetical protein